MVRCNFLLLAVLFFTTLLQTRAQDSDYRLILLDPIGFDIHRTYATDIDDMGNVVGEIDAWVDGLSGDKFRIGFYYMPALDQYWFTEPDFNLTGMNNLGQYVGDYRGPNFLGHVWGFPGAAPQPLPPLSGDQQSGARGINDAGLVAGWSWDELRPDVLTPVLWRLTDTGVSDPLPLPLIDGHEFGLAERIGPSNANGVVGIVGYSRVSGYGTEQIAVSWTVKLKSNGKLRIIAGPNDLGTLGPGYGDVAKGVNVKRFVVGGSGDHAFKKSRSGTMRALKKLTINGGPALRGIAHGISSQKHIVGWQSRDNQSHAVIWLEGKSVVDLTEKVDLPRKHTITHAQGINDAGHIIVTHRHRQGQYRAGILIPMN